MTLTLTIDGREVRASRGDTVLEAALNNGVYIPNLCADPDLEATGGCRLCLVEIEGRNDHIPSCTVEAADHMVIRTRTPRLQEMRRDVLELIFREHPRPCMDCWRRKRCGPDDICLRNVRVTDRCVVCPKNERCDLQKAADYLKLKRYEFVRTERNIPLDTRNPFYGRDLNKCIMCSKCARVCRDIRGVMAIDPGNSGFASSLAGFGNRPLVDENCISCGACISKCPVGAIFQKDEDRADTEVRTTCPYCGVGCAVKLGVRDGRIVSVWPDSQSVVNHGYLCVKGHFGIKDMVHYPDRLTSPLFRRGDRFVKASWDEALDMIASRLGAYSRGEVGVVSSSKCTNEENYVTQKFARTVLGTNNVDQCARL